VGLQGVGGERKAFDPGAGPPERFDAWTVARDEGSDGGSR
jgi:hypothetical protein